MVNTYTTQIYKYIITYRKARRVPCPTCIFYKDNLCQMYRLLHSIIIDCSNIDAAKYFGTDNSLLYISNIRPSLTYKLLL